MDSAVVVTCLSVALLAGLPAVAQTAKPATPAKTAAAASAPADDDLAPPPGFELSDRVKREAARPMYWIKMHAEPAKEPAKETAKAPSPAPARPPAPVAPPAAPAVATKEPAKDIPKDAGLNHTPATATAAAAVAPQAKASPPLGDGPVSLATGAQLATSNPGASGGPPAAGPAPAPTATAPAEQAVALATPSVAPPVAKPPAPPPPAPVEDLSPVQLVILNGREPQFPDSLMRRLRKGTVQIRIDVNNAGEVTETNVVQSSNPRLDQPAMEAVRAMRFQPIRRPTTAILNFGFDLDS
ncbi:MAG TPA: TonB family protein [Ideonella sp.]|uniref:energy transducer TonB n=1 Tax=Ideonella sp. TaxID=1929293 RepID=UPI002BB72E9A|nr:TonB family protein [Ideonella sp.]HSI50795.1 TonB family protein [Ideonella sp.]